MSLLLKGSDYIDHQSINSMREKFKSDLIYVDESGATISLIEVDQNCCKPIRVKCKMVKKNKEKCSVKKGEIWK